MSKRVSRAYLVGLFFSSFMVSGLATASEEPKKDDAAMLFFQKENTDYAPPSALLSNVKNRETQSLNGDWNIVIDEAGKVLKFAFGQGYFTDLVKPRTGMELAEVSFDARQKLKVPGDWNSQDPILDRYRGKIVYHKPLTIKKVEGERYYLYFDGANYTTDVFINGKSVGRHEGGYVAFNFDVTDYVNDGDNELLVRVDAFLDETTVPTMGSSDFWKYGGLIRDVSLVTVSDQHIGQYHVYLADRAKGLIKGWVQLEDASEESSLKGQKINVRIPEIDVDVVAVTNRSGRAEFSFKADLNLWSPEDPKLYDVRLAHNGDELKDKIGFRTIETEGKQIILNGSPVKMYGISMHEETILRKGMANNRADAQAQLALIKELGANFVRLAHYPHNEHTVSLADEMGLLVWSEIPIVSSIDWTNEHTQKVAQNQIVDNISRDLNRASVVMWSIANETFPRTDERLLFLKNLADTVDRLDESDRLVAAALIGNMQEEFGDVIERLVVNLLHDSGVSAQEKANLMAFVAQQSKAKKASSKNSEKAQHSVNEPAVVMIDDPLGEIVDIIGYNEYFGWYYSSLIARILPVGEDAIRKAMFEIMPDIRFANTYGKPMIISEFGAGAKAGLHSEKATIWSEEYQEKVYKAQLSMLEKSDFVQGMSPWILKDFRSHIRQLNGIQETYNRKGLVSETGVKKKAFYVLKDHYHNAMSENDKSEVADR